MRTAEDNARVEASERMRRSCAKCCMTACDERPTLCDSLALRRARAATMVRMRQQQACGTGNVQAEVECELHHGAGMAIARSEHQQVSRRCCPLRRVGLQCVRAASRAAVNPICSGRVDTTHFGLLPRLALSALPRWYSETVSKTARRGCCIRALCTHLPFRCA